MLAKIASQVYVLIALLLSSNAYCYITPPTFIPANPLAGENVSLTMEFGICDGFTNQVPLSLTRNGNTVEVIYSTLTSNYCNIPAATLTTSLGLFAAGNYSIVIKRSNSYLGQPLTISTIGTYAMLVQQGVSATPVPSHSLSFLIILAAGLILTSAIIQRRRSDIILGACIISDDGATEAADLPELKPTKVLLSLSVARDAPTPEEVFEFVSTPTIGGAGHT